MKVNMSKAIMLILVLTVVLLSFPNSVLSFSLPSETSSFKLSEMDQVDKLYAKPTAPGDGDCSSWENACTLQEAIAQSGTIKFIWVAEGTHKPTTTNDRTISFVLKDGISIYGGFPPAGGNWIDRNWTLYPTILSGDIGAPTDQTDNSYHVVNSSGVTSNAVLDGFFIRSGYAIDSVGGGIFNISGSPTLANLFITNNSAPTGWGGGMYNNHNSNPNLTNVIIENNLAVSGAGMYNEDSSPVLTSVTFSDNIADSCGGGMYNEGGSPSLTDVIFYRNSAWGIMDGGGGMCNLGNTTAMLNKVTFMYNTSAYIGGGMANWNASPILINVTFSGNSALYGGAIGNEHGSPTLMNVTIVGNQAGTIGSGLYNQQGLLGSSHPTLTSSIIWGNWPSTDQVWNDGLSSTTITYSDIEGGWAGTGNINANPLLGPLEDNGGFTRTHALFHGSPAIDNGHPTLFLATDQRGFPRPYDGNGDGVALPDMGAYESEFSYGYYLPIILN